MKKKWFYLIIVFLIVASFAAFGRIVGNDFINFDDPGYITDNIHVQSGFNLQSIKWAFTAIVVSNWHPLTLLSHMLDWTLFGNNAGGHHLMSLFFHIGTVIFLFLFLLKTTNNFWPAAFAAAFFALHPLRVESVAWASERKDVLSMFFGMASIYAYAFYAESSKLSKYFLCLILFILSLMSKPMLVTLPFVLLLLDYWPLKRVTFSDSTGGTFRAARRLVIEKIPFFLLSVSISSVAFWAQKKVGAMVNVQDISFAERLSNAFVSYTAYLWKTFWPIHLAVFYPFPSSLSIWKIMIAVFVIILTTLTVIYVFKKLPFLFTGWFLYLGTLIPVIGLVQVGDQSMADRYTYLPSVGIAIMLAWGIPLLFKSEAVRKKVLFPAAVAVLITLSVLTWQQCGQWKNSHTLFSHALQATNDNYKMHHNMGVFFFDKGKMNEAFYHFNKALLINPNDRSFNSRGELYARAGRFDQAIDDFAKAISLNPGDATGYYNRGLAYDKTGQYQSAIADYNTAVSLKKDFINAYINRGIIYAKAGRYQTAIIDFSKVIAMKPDYIHAYSNRAIAYFSQGENITGCADAKKACELGNCATLNAARGKGLCP
jgi:tetratricopeptide (TPR) repeat protein